MMRVPCGLTSAVMPAGTQIMTTVQDSSLLTPWAGIGVLSLYAIAAIWAGAVMLKRRDA